MNFINLTIMNIKRYLKNPLILIMAFVLPIIILFGVFATDYSSEKLVGIIDNDNSKYSKELCKEIEEYFKIKRYEDTKKYIKDLKDYKVGAVYIIESNFSENLINGIKPKVTEYVTEESGGALFSRSIINGYIEKVQNNNSSSINTVIKNYDDEEKEKYTLVMIMICYLMLITSTMISEDIIKMKFVGVLKRTLSTGNSDKAILGSIFLASFLIQSILTMGAFTIIILVLKIHIFSILITMLVIVLTALVSTGLIIFTTRWIKNPALSSVINILYGLFSMVLAMLYYGISASSKIPEIFERLQFLSPICWVINILEGKNILISSLVIILMFLVFFTAGTFKVEDFTK